MNTPLRFTLRHTALCALGLTALSAQATVLPLNFNGGAGTTGVDQYTGTAGSGWSSAWSATFHSGITNGGAAIGSSSPLTAGGGDYLQVNYDTTSAASGRLARLARQWDTTAISLTDPFTVAFDFRSNVNTASATQTLVLFGSNTSATGTGASDSWKITADGGGWSAFNGTTAVPLGAGTVVANHTWHISLTIDPVADTYSVSLQNLTTSSAVFTVGGLALRSGADSSLSWLNFHANGAASTTGLGFAIDSVSITSSTIPEPAGASLLFGGLALGGAMLGRRRRAGR